MIQRTFVFTRLRGASSGARANRPIRLLGRRRPAPRTGPPTPCSTVCGASNCCTRRAGCEIAAGHTLSPRRDPGTGPQLGVCSHLSPALHHIALQHVPPVAVRQDVASHHGEPGLVVGGEHTDTEIEAEPQPSGPRRVCGRRLGPALMRQVVVAPRIEHHERPKDLAVVAPTVQMLRNELCHRRRVEEATASHTRRRQPGLHDTP